MQDVADAAMMSRAAVYLHFKNKDDLFRSLMQWHHGEALKAAKQPLRRTTPFLARLEAALMAFTYGPDRSGEGQPVRAGTVRGATWLWPATSTQQPRIVYVRLMENAMSGRGFQGRNFAVGRRRFPRDPGRSLLRLPRRHQEGAERPGRGSTSVWSALIRLIRRRNPRLTSGSLPRGKQCDSREPFARCSAIVSFSMISASPPDASEACFLPRSFDNKAAEIEAVTPEETDRFSLRQISTASAKSALTSRPRPALSNRARMAWMRPSERIERTRLSVTPDRLTIAAAKKSILPEHKRMQQEGRRQAAGRAKMFDQIRDLIGLHCTCHADGGPVAGFAGDALDAAFADRGLHEAEAGKGGADLSRPAHGGRRPAGPHAPADGCGSTRDGRAGRSAASTSGRKTAPARFQAGSALLPRHRFRRSRRQPAGTWPGARRSPRGSPAVPLAARSTRSISFSTGEREMTA